MPNLIQTLALAEVFPEGQKITAFALKYDCTLRADLLVPGCFEVVDRSLEPAIQPVKRTITRVYRNNVPARSAVDQPGEWVILETAIDEKEAFAICTYNYKGQPDPFAPGPACYSSGEKNKKGVDKSLRGPGGGPGPHLGYCGPKPLRVLVRQLFPVPSMSGEIVPKLEAPCTELSCPDVERFQLRYCDDLPYNLFIPEEYNPEEKYPLIMFIPDAGGRGTDTKAPLIQGIGGVIWSRPEEQKKHPCFVVCPCFGPDEILTHDDFTCLPRLYKIKELLDEVVNAFSIDRDRIYTTGQSMGCMTSCELMCTYPDYFTGAMLVAGQWDPERCGKAMANKKLWILVSWNDLKAHPGMDAVCEAIESSGGSVARSTLDGSLPPEELSAKAEKAIYASANVQYTLFEGDTVVPDDQNKGPGSNHTNTWRVAYTISSVRDWLFKT